MKRFFGFLAFSFLFCANVASAQTVCNTPSGFLKALGPITVGNNLTLGPDCQTVVDNGLPGGASIQTLNGLGGNVVIQGSNGITVSASAPNITLSPPLYPPEMLCNPEMVFDQRNEGAAYTSTSVEVYGPDCQRFVGAGAGTFTVRRFAGVSLDFPYALQTAVTVQNVTPAATDNFHWEHAIEGQYIQPLGFGTASARTFTYSEYLACSVNGNYAIGFMNGANSRYFVQTVNYTGGGGFQRLSITVPGDTGGSWPTTMPPLVDGIGMKIIHNWGSGSNFTVAASSVWASGAAWNVTGSTQLMAQTAGNLCYATGMQIDLGSQMLPYRYRDWDAMLRRVRRYIRKSFPLGTQALQAQGAAGSANYTVHGAGAVNDSVYINFGDVELFQPPIVTYYNPIVAGATWRNLSLGTNEAAPTTINAGMSGFGISNTQSAGTSVNNIDAVHWVAAACPGNSGAGTGC